jgi:hypothetical protein
VSLCKAPWFHLVTIFVGCSAALGANVEVKFGGNSGEFEQAKKVFNLAARKSEKREIYYFDRTDLSLFSTGLVLRARLGDDKNSDSTVKLRPADSSKVDKKWFQLPGFKCEIEYVGDRDVESCSLTKDFSANKLKEHLANKRFKKVFDSNQEEFIATFYRSVPDWSQVKVFGPVYAQEWKTDLPILSNPAVVERWVLGQNVDVIEYSFRADGNVARKQAEDFRVWLEANGLHVTTMGDSKTRKVIDYFNR